MLNICTGGEPLLLTVCISRVPSLAGVSGSLSGVERMQADGESVTCRSSSLGRVALTAVNYTPVSISSSSGKRQHEPSVLWSSQLCGSLRKKELEEAWEQLQVQ